MGTAIIELVLIFISKIFLVQLMFKKSLNMLSGIMDPAGFNLVKEEPNQNHQQTKLFPNNCGS